VPAGIFLQSGFTFAEDNEPAADRFVELLTHHSQLLGKHPYAGRRRDDLRSSFPVREYLILYRSCTASWIQALESAMWCMDAGYFRAVRTVVE